MWFNEWFSEYPNKVALAKFLRENKLAQINLLLDRQTQEVCINFLDENNNTPALFLKFQTWLANEEILNQVVYVSTQTALASGLEPYTIGSLTQPSHGQNVSPAKGFRKK